MAEWRAGIKLLLATYNGPELTLTSKKNSFSDIVMESRGHESYPFLFEKSDFFDGMAFSDAAEGSTKGTALHHHFNNFALSPSRANEAFAAELDLVVTEDGFNLPIKNEYIRTKWFVEAYNEVLKKLSAKEYTSYRKKFEKAKTTYLDIFSLHTHKVEKNAPDVNSEAPSIFPISVILLGPPGTGKTRASALIASDIFEGKKPRLDPAILNSMVTDSRIESYRNDYYTIQFHPSFTYEDFFEGLRPLQVQNGTKTDISYAVIPGVFKVICQLARAYWEIGKYGIDFKIQYLSPSDNEGSVGKWVFANSPLASLYKFENRKGYILYNKEKVLLTGPQMGRELVVKEGSEPVSSGIYSVIWFPDEESTVKPFVLFIDELNRGNPAKIFGEALSLIEETKRIGRPEKAEIILPYSHEQFSVPPNLHIICAMNSSDKSLMSLDQAFRRRFKFVYLPPHFEMFVNPAFVEQSRIFSLEILRALCAHFSTINEALRETHVPQENLIGHSYLFKILRESYEDTHKDKNLNVVDTLRKNLRNTWETELHPQIREIVGEHRLTEFCENFKRIVSTSSKDDAMFLQSKTDIANSLEKYLDDIQPKQAAFPWNEAA